MKSAIQEFGFPNLMFLYSRITQNRHLIDYQVPYASRDLILKYAEGTRNAPRLCRFSLKIEIKQRSFAPWINRGEELFRSIFEVNGGWEDCKRQITR